MMNPTHIFQAEDIVAGYDNKTILHGISLVIPSNKISVIIGANACGKSTLLKTLAKLIKPTSGKITLDGKSISKIPPKGMMYWHYRLVSVPALVVSEHC